MFKLIQSIFIKIFPHVETLPARRKIDRNFITEKGFSLITPVLITNVDSVKSITPNEGINVTAGQTPVVEYTL